MEPIKIDINNYEQAGLGANGVSYNNPNDPDEMLKMYELHYDTKDVVMELGVAQKVYKLGIPSPEPGILVTDGERYGIQFRRIKDKISYARAVSKYPDQIEYLAREFAKESKKLHATEVPDDLFYGVKEQFLYFLKYDTAFTPEERQKVADFINAAPESTCALHGDLHFGNCIISGDPFPADGKPLKNLWIDLAFFSRGYYMFDLGMTYIVTHITEEFFLLDQYHMNAEMAKKFWDAFIVEYFETDDPVILAEKEEEIKKYAAIKSFFIEYCCDRVMLPHFVQFIRETLLS